MTTLRNCMSRPVRLQNCETGESITIAPDESVQIPPSVQVQQSSHLWPLVWLVGIVGFFAAVDSRITP